MEHIRKPGMTRCILKGCTEQGDQWGGSFKQKEGGWGCHAEAKSGRKHARPRCPQLSVPPTDAHPYQRGAPAQEMMGAWNREEVELESKVYEVSSSPAVPRPFLGVALR